MSDTAIRKFNRLSLITLIAVYFLILVGGIVRTTGSGMGCPDWPKCFGQWIPPTAANQLPNDYKQQYAQLRESKNKKFANMLSALGMEETASRILNDPTILEEADFNPLKTYIEYINRLIGVIIGFLIIALFLSSIKFRKNRPLLFWVSVMTLITVLFQGWLGSIVVSTNLTSWTITIHMFIAFVIVMLLVYLLHYSGEAPEKMNVKPLARYTMLCAIFLLIAQVFLGTEVRTAIDSLSDNLIARANWIESLGMEFLIHRSFSWLVLFTNLGLLFQLRKTTSINPLSITVVLLILLSVLTGVGMAYFNVPAFLQPVHLMIATVAFGTQLLLFFRMKPIN